MVLRRPSAYVLTWTSLAIVLFLIFGVTAVPPPNSTLADNLQEVVLLSVIGWLLRLLGACSRIVLRPEGLTVVNWMVRWEVPWAAFDSVVDTGELVIRLTDGRTIEPLVGGGSLISALMRNSTPRRMVDAIEAYRPDVPATNTQPARWKVDLQPVRFLVVLGVLIALTILLYQVS